MSAFAESIIYTIIYSIIGIILQLPTVCMFNDVGCREALGIDRSLINVHIRQPHIMNESEKRNM